MPKLRILSGTDVVKILEGFNFKIKKQRGSHLKLWRQSESGESQTLTIPDHQELDRGTLKAIFNQASRYVSADELRRHFYN